MKKHHDNKCKHGLTKDTCAMCIGLVIPYGELQYKWIDFVDDTFENTHKNVKDQPDKDTWFKKNKQSLIWKFYLEWKQKPLYPTWPEK